MQKANLLFSKIDIQRKWPEFLLIAILIFTAYSYLIFSGSRFFDFDEFQVLYAGASMEKGKALYSDKIGIHFPFFNICIRFILWLTGFHSTTIIVCRYFISIINIISLFFLYKIGKILWNKRTGLLSVVLVLFSVIFLKKGIEIRHDVFNMMFDIIGVYCLLRYLNEKKFRYIFLSALSLGLGLASTQKAAIWIFGIITGVTLFYLKGKDFRGWIKANIIYVITIPLPLVFCLLYLMVFNHESVYKFFNYAIANTAVKFAPLTKEAYPFPYNRWDMFGDIIFWNPLFYAIGIAGIFLAIISWSRAPTSRIVIAVWALIGLLFYITAKRPFYQSLLPTIPALAVSASGFIDEIFRRLRSGPVFGKVVVGVVLIFFLFIWPFHFIRTQLFYNPKLLDAQLDNISFCLAFLKPSDKVLCFTQNQIFFDQILRMSNTECGRLIYEYDADCFQRRMIAEQCKVIIYDHRTRLLNNKIQEKIRENYFPARIGNILIPGFKVSPKKTRDKEIWIEGYYYSPTLSLEIDGKKIEENVIQLKQKKYIFYNGANNSVPLIYIFDKEKFVNDISDMKMLTGKT
jgi:hypothetical protein